MKTYYLILNAFLLFSTLILLRHSFFRFRYFLQMFQQHGYKTNEIISWIFRNFYSRVLLTEHFLYLIVLFSILLLMSDRLTVTAATLILGLFALFWFGQTRRFRPERDKKPLVYTARMKRLATTMGALALFTILAVIDLSFTGRLLNTSVVIRDIGNPNMLADPYFLLFGLLLVDISIPLFLILAAWLMKPVEHRIHERFKQKARAKLARMPDLKIIAITGSYGKTSTKFLLETLLKERFQVCVTPGSFNTPMGICKVINNRLEPRHQILILEMGARYEGNIRELCGIAQPDVAIITNVGKAHLETFGSVEAIAREKSTLARELTTGGVLVLNSDDRHVAEMARINSEVRVLETGIRSGSVRAVDIQYDEEGTRFTLQIMDKELATGEQQINLPLLGAHNVQNFLLAATTALSFGIRPGTIAFGAKQVRPVEHRLELKKQGGLTIIDDAFNSNPVGAHNAVDILTSFRTGRKIIITPGMIELGDIQYEENRRFGKKIADAGLDLVILVGREQTRPILDGLREGSMEEGRITVVSTLFEGNEKIREYSRDGDVVLYENDLPDSFNE